jgi:hypothetical protein
MFILILLLVEEGFHLANSPMGGIRWLDGSLGIEPTEAGIAMVNSLCQAG